MPTNDLELFVSRTFEIGLEDHGYGDRTCYYCEEDWKDTSDEGSFDGYYYHEFEISKSHMPNGNIWAIYSPIIMPRIQSQLDCDPIDNVHFTCEEQIDYVVIYCCIGP